ncbi:MAG: heavy-metal-associated domain-containing protein [Lachnospiraceae bacterium]|nr:heavy-metal-associated domain-containing protein [Lachnospiraceae bacterium]
MAGTIAVSIILIVVIIASIAGVVKRIKYGSSCCGEKDAAPSKIKVKDRNKSHYRYIYYLEVDGMHCSGCVRKIENEFNKNEGMWAKADLENKQVKLLSKNEVDRNLASKIVSDSGFTMLSYVISK